MSRITMTKTVVPIYGARVEYAEDDEPKLEYTFLGTGFFVESRFALPILVTCEHVLEGQADNGGFFIAVPGPENSPLLPQAVPLVRDRSLDLALLGVYQYEPDYKLTVLENDEEIVFNRRVVTTEYSSKEVRGENVANVPATRIGNVTRLVQMTDRLGEAGRDALELSFPALRGASGAPVMVEEHRFGKRVNVVWGIVTGNTSYELLPAQVETIVDEESGVREEIKYILPQGLAIHVRHLRLLLERLESALASEEAEGMEGGGAD